MRAKVAKARGKAASKRKSAPRRAGGAATATRMKSAKAEERVLLKEGERAGGGERPKVAELADARPSSAGYSFLPGSFKGRSAAPPPLPIPIASFTI